MSIVNCSMNEQSSRGVDAFDATLKLYAKIEANIDKIDRILTELQDLLPNGIFLGSISEYDDLIEDFIAIRDELPSISQKRVESDPILSAEIGQWRLDATEIGEPEAMIALDEEIEKPYKEVRAYKRALNRNRKKLIRGRVDSSLSQVASLLSELSKNIADDAPPRTKVESPKWEELRNTIRTIETLLGNNPRTSQAWGDLRRHLRFGMVVDYRDIVDHDWSLVRQEILDTLYEENDPIPIDINELDDPPDIGKEQPVSSELNWKSLNDEEFERLIFNLISSTEGYENPQWLTRTKASDRGRDLSVTRVRNDRLSGVNRQRVIIQCKHSLSRSTNLKYISVVKEQMLLWSPPRVDVLVVASSGRFTDQVVSAIEQHNLKDTALSIELWPDSLLETLLAARPGLVAEFGLI